MRKACAMEQKGRRRLSVKKPKNSTKIPKNFSENFAEKECFFEAFIDNGIIVSGFLFFFLKQSYKNSRKF